MPTLLGSGTVTDGGGVAAVQIFVVRPDGSSTIVTATPDGPARTAFFVFNQPGVYQALVVATDLAGNKATQSLAAITATGATIPPQIPAVSAMGSGAVTPATSTFFLRHGRRHHGDRGRRLACRSHQRRQERDQRQRRQHCRQSRRQLDGVAWSAEGITVVVHDPAYHTLIVVLTHLSEFGLFASAPTALEPGEEPNLTPQIYLPVVAR